MFLTPTPTFILGICDTTFLSVLYVWQEVIGSPFSHRFEKESFKLLIMNWVVEHNRKCHHRVIRYMSDKTST